MKKLLSALICLTLLMCAAGSALARTVTVSGTVVSTRTEIVTAAVGGYVQDVFAAEGDSVKQGDTLADLKTTKVYATQDGVVRLFGEAGDDAASVTALYGAVVYVEPLKRYSVSTTTKNAYSAEANKIIHPGETVYLRGGESNKHTAVGRVTTVEDSSYTVEIISGRVEIGDTVNIYRNRDYEFTSRLGNGTVSLNSPVAYTAEGLIVSFGVKDGDQVQKGDVLFETLEGSYTNVTQDLTHVKAPSDGVISAVNVSRGSKVAVGDSVAEIYLDDGLRVEAKVTESKLQFFRVGGSVFIEFPYLENGEFTTTGVIESVSRIGAASETEDTEEASYSVWIKPSGAEELFYGLHALVSASSEEIFSAEEPVEEAPEPALEEEAEEAVQEASEP